MYGQFFLRVIVFFVGFYHMSSDKLDNHPNWEYLPVDNCGYGVSSDRIVGGKEAALGQFPWIARIGYKMKRNQPKVVYLCAATLLNQWYLLTAVHCAVGALADSIYSVRLGENYIKQKKDCDADVCAPPVQDIEVADVIKYDNYVGTLAISYGDIGLIKLSKPAQYNGENEHSAVQEKVGEISDSTSINMEFLQFTSLFKLERFKLDIADIIKLEPGAICIAELILWTNLPKLQLKRSSINPATKWRNNLHKSPIFSCKKLSNKLPQEWAGNNIFTISPSTKGEYFYFVQPICLPRERVVDEINDLLAPDKSTIEVAGWGMTNSISRHIPNELMFVRIPIVGLDVCRRNFKPNKIDESQICVGVGGGKDSCVGDSGGPLMNPVALRSAPKYYLFGVVSYGMKLCGISAAVYTNVTYYMEWILNHIDQ